MSLFKTDMPKNSFKKRWPRGSSTASFPSGAGEGNSRNHALIDVDAGRIATGHATIEDIGWELFRLTLDVASGRTQTWADR